MLTNSRLTGRRLILMRLLWAAVAVVFAVLDALTAELVRMVQETMQPEHLSVWLKETR